METLLTITDAAKRLGVARQTLTRWADRGDIATVTMGGNRRVRSIDVDALLNPGADAPRKATQA